MLPYTLLRLLTGYTIQVVELLSKATSHYIVLTNEKGKRHYFTMIKADGEWIIQNPETVAPFIVEIEKDIAKIIFPAS